MHDTHQKVLSGNWLIPCISILTSGDAFLFSATALCTVHIVAIRRQATVYTAKSLGFVIQNNEVEFSSMSLTFVTYSTTR